MAEILTLDPHDPLPEGSGKQLIVLRRFEEDDPDQTVVEIILVAKRGDVETTRPMHNDRTPMNLTDAIKSAQAVAASESIQIIHVIDRTSGPREQDILQHHGDHSVHMEQLDDFDLEEGERGSDMRDRR